MPQRQWKGGAASTTIPGGITGTPATFTVASATGFPTGALPFVVTVGRGLASEEKILVTRAGTTTLTVVTRGYDSTASVDHPGTPTCEHTIAAVVLDELDAHLYDTTRNDHSQYLKSDGSGAFSGVAQIANSLPTNSALGDAAAIGPGNVLARSTHVHGREAPSIIGHTFTISGDVLVPVGDIDFVCPLFIPEAAGRTIRLIKARHRINGGTSVTVKLQINGADATGFTGISVTTTSTTTDPADITTIADGDLLALVVTGVSGSPKNLTFTVYLEHA